MKNLILVLVIFELQYHGDGRAENFGRPVPFPFLSNSVLRRAEEQKTQPAVQSCNTGTRLSVPEHSSPASLHVQRVCRSTHETDSSG